MKSLRAGTASALAAGLLIGGCASAVPDPGGAVREPAAAPPHRDTRSPPPKPLSADAEAPTGEKDRGERERTLPGKERAGTVAPPGTRTLPDGPTVK